MWARLVVILLGFQRRLDRGILTGNGGHYPPGSRQVIDIHDCSRMTPDLSQVIPDLAGMATLGRLPGTGLFIAPGVRRAPARAGLGVSFLFNQAQAHGAKKLGAARSFTNSLALCEPPVVLPYRPLVTVHER